MGVAIGFAFVAGVVVGFYALRKAVHERYVAYTDAKDREFQEMEQTLSRLEESLKGRGA